MRSLRLFLLSTILFSCFPSSDIHREEGKVFLASLPDSGIGGLFFALYNDQQYQICSSGGIGQDCYSGRFIVNNDTLTLLDLPPEIEFSSNCFLIQRVIQSKENDLGRVIPIVDPQENQKALDRDYFLIRFDSLHIRSGKAFTP